MANTERSRRRSEHLDAPPSAAQVEAIRRATVTLPTLRFAYGSKPVHYRDGRLYVAGRPISRRREP